VDINYGLTVGGGGKDLGFTGRYGGISINNPGKDLSQGFNP
jgi:hypothetical protein